MKGREASKEGLTQFQTDLLFILCCWAIVDFLKQDLLHLPILQIV